MIELHCRRIRAQFEFEFPQPNMDKNAHLDHFKNIITCDHNRDKISQRGSAHQTFCNFCITVDMIAEGSSFSSDVFFVQRCGRWLSFFLLIMEM